MDLISRNSDEGYINLKYPRMISAETYQKYNLHLVKSTKADDCKDFTKEMEKEIKIWPQKMFGKNFQDYRFQLQHI